MESPSTPNHSITITDDSGVYHRVGSLLHRDGDLPAVEWYMNGKMHRENDLPAVEFAGTKKWYVSGRLYRVVSSDWVE